MTGRTDSSALLRAPGVAAALLGTAPAWLWDIEDGRILLASAAGIAFFGETTLDALRQREFGAGRPEAAQIARIGRTLPRDGTSRLSMLRVFVGFRDIPLPCQCRMVGERGDGLVLVVAGAGGTRDDIAARATTVLGGLSVPTILKAGSDEIHRNDAAAGPPGGAPLHGGSPVTVQLPEGTYDLLVLDTGQGQAGQDAGETGGNAEPSACDPAPISTDAGDGTHGAGDADPDPASAEAETGEAPSEVSPDVPAAGRTAATDRRGPGLPKTRRFTFLLDPDGRFVEIGAGFAALVGPRSADVIGRSWSELDSEMALDPHGALAGAIETRDTWSDVRVDWPTDDGGRVGLRLSALPRFAEGRAFAGYRGFADVLDVVPSGDEADRPAAGDDADSGQAATERPKKAKKPGKRSTDHDGDGAETAHETDRNNSKIHRLRTGQAGQPQPEQRGSLNDQERSAFKAIAAALGARWHDELPEDQAAAPEAETATATETVRAPAAKGAGDRPLPNGTPADREGTAESAPQTSADQAGQGSDSRPGPSSALSGEVLPDSESPDTLIQDVLDRIPLGLAVLREQRLLMANRAFLDLFDYPDLRTLEDAGGFRAVIDDRSDTTMAAHTAVVARRRDGSPVSVRARLGRTPWIDGPAMLVSVREAQSDAEDAAGEPGLSAAELRAVVDAAVDGVLVVEADATIVTANGSAERLLGIDAAELAGGSMLELIAEDGREAAAELLSNLVAAVPTLVEKGLDVTLLGADDPVDVTLSMARLGTRYPARFCAVLRDMTDWKEAEADLVAARKRAEDASSQKSDFLAKMSHEIRTPLNGIIGFSEIILEERFGPFGNDRYRDYIRDIRESGEHLMSLVNDLLDLSKVEAGKLDLSFTGVKLNDLAEQSVAIMQPQASKARVIVRTNLWPTLPAVVADIRSVRQVLLNLLSNAIKFTPPGGQVIVSTVLGEGGDVFVRVRDTGPGMSGSDVAVALEPFRQLPVTPTGSQRGTGLGLPLSKALVEANRASFSLQSKVGDGTLVEICFPQSRVLAE
ncbi:ATP-binding protein [Microbaculum marinum]|uniref:histidine kinase n=1 Tax=Microbaculum marinum TaxID=1764581 RepID=A0AAW9RUA2_9HYPH